jgi:dimethylargininase
MAITRPVPAGLARCELTHLARVPIDVARAAAQHEAYEAALGALGCVVRRLPAADDLPDSVFVEDAAIVLDEVAILTRPGAASRRPEVASVAAVLAEYRPLRALDAPATLDGGDVLHAGNRLFVGVSSRTNEAGAGQLASIVAPLGYSVTTVVTADCLHLKSAVTSLAPGTLLCNPRWIDTGRVEGFDIVEIDPSEPHAANVLRIGETIVMAAAHPRTADRLRRRGLDVRVVDVSELAKAEAGVTCCSLIVD